MRGLRADARSRAPSVVLVVPDQLRLRAESASELVLCPSAKLAQFPEALTDTRHTQSSNLVPILLDWSIDKFTPL
jgi:hypothetical protein